jgi:hypothetical protein
MLRTRSALVVVIVGLLSSGCPGTPGELQPLFDAIVGLPAYLVEPTPPASFEMPLRNVGETAVEITSFSFEDNDAAPGQSESFTNLEFDVTSVEPGEQAVLRFNYTTPNGEAQEAVLVVESDSTTKPVLEIPVSTVEYIVNPPPDGGVEDAGDLDDAGGLDDAGQLDDAGSVGDAGSVDDAGTVGDAGLTDAGPVGDAGNPVDAGGGDAGVVDAGPTTDAGETDASSPDASSPDAG